MNLNAQDEVEKVQEEGYQLLNVTFVQGAALPENRAYLDGCSTVTTFKTDKYLKGIKTLTNGIKINCNAGAVTTNQMGSYGNLKVWHLLEGITNIFSMHELEKLYRITYDSWMGHYVVHTPKGAVNFYKDEQGLPYMTLMGQGKRQQLCSCNVCRASGAKLQGNSLRQHWYKRCKEIMKATPRRTS